MCKMKCFEKILTGLNKVVQMFKDRSLFYLSANGKRKKVRKFMFLHTLSISNNVVFKPFKNLQTGGVVKPDQRGKNTPPKNP